MCDIFPKCVINCRLYLGSSTDLTDEVLAQILAANRLSRYSILG
jgi:hypothetical protein